VFIAAFFSSHPLKAQTASFKAAIERTFDKSGFCAVTVDVVEAIVLAVIGEYE
jgi:hypothetical protein